MDGAGEHGAYERTIAAWRGAAEAGDARAAAQCLADNVEVVSPLTAQFRFHGREQVTRMLEAAFEVVDDTRCHTGVGDGAIRALFFHCRVGREHIEEAQLVRLGPTGLIQQVTLFGRPLPGLTAVMAGIGPGLLRRQGRPGLARVIRLATAPLAALTRFGERRVVPVADPARGPRPPAR